VVDCVFPASLNTGGDSALIKLVITSLKVRGVGNLCKIPASPVVSRVNNHDFGDKSVESHIQSVLNNRNLSSVTKRRLLERALRPIAFSHRKGFPEIKKSALVREWERITGLTWT
jgi:hypothetical protein